MNQNKLGELIRFLRLREGLTQVQLADKLGLSDKAVSKWERGRGAPDISTLPLLADIFHCDTETLLLGELPIERKANGNVKKMRFFVCPRCGNIINALDGVAVNCCGNRLDALEVQTSSDAHHIHIEESDGDWYITADHTMTRTHYISFIALLTEDTLMLKKLYPEWMAEARFPLYSHGVLYYYCTEHGLFQQKL